MNRREALKVAAVSVAAVTATTMTGCTGGETGTAAAGAEARMKEEHMNRLEMKAKNPAKMEKGELKHTPQITIGSKDAKGYTLVEITVGQGGIIHPSTPDHWIDFISLSADGKLIGKNVLEPEISRGYSSFAVKLDNVKSLTAKAGCNLHGIWTSTFKLI